MTVSDRESLGLLVRRVSPRHRSLLAGSLSEADHQPGPIKVNHHEVNQAVEVLQCSVPQCPLRTRSLTRTNV